MRPDFDSVEVTRPLSAFLWLAMMGCHALWAHGELAAVDLIDLPKNRSRSKRFLHPGTQLGTGNLNSGNILGTSWELGTWEFIARNGLLGGHLGNQNHWSPHTGQPIVASRSRALSGRVTTPL